MIFKSVNKYFFFLILFILFDVSTEIKILYDHFTFYALYHSILRHPLSFFLIATFPYLSKKLNR